DADGQGSKELTFTILNKVEYQLGYPASNGGSDLRKFSFGDTISFAGIRWLIRVKSRADVERFSNTPFILSFTPSAQLTGSYVNRLNAAWAETGAGIINLSLNGPNPGKNKDFLAGLIKR